MKYGSHIPFAIFATARRLGAVVTELVQFRR